MYSLKKNHRYVYANLDRTTDPTTGIRFYKSPSGELLPSVTTILGITKDDKDKAGLQGWIDWVGEDKANQIKNEAANVGTLMHLKLEQHCLGTSKKPGSNLIHQQAHKMAQEIIKHGLSQVSEIWGIEVPLYYDGLYAGTTDLVGKWHGQPAIMDFKQSNKRKTDERVGDYKLQLAAYGLAHNKTHGTSIKTGVILMCTRKLEYQEWVISKGDFEEAEHRWLDRVAKYYEVTHEGSTATSG